MYWYYSCISMVLIIASISQAFRQITTRRLTCVATSTTTRLRCFTLERVVHPSSLSKVQEFYECHYSIRKQQQRGKLPKKTKEKGTTDSDVIYVLRNKKKISPATSSSIVAAVRLTRKAANTTFLRSLCVDRNLRRQGIALEMIQKATQDFDVNNTTTYYLFAEPALAPLYNRAGFVHQNYSNSSKEEENQQHHSASDDKSIWHSYKTVAASWKRKNRGELACFVKKKKKKDSQQSYGAGSSCVNDDDIRRKHPVKIVLLQHANELKRKTATGPLLFDNWQSQLSCSSSGSVVGREDDNNCSYFVSHDDLIVECWTWAGRADNPSIQNLLKQAQQQSTPILVWTESGGSKTMTALANDGVTYIILDGTWQEAKSMFRKMPFLWKLPRLLLLSDKQSTYTLRKNFGWRQRFGGEEKNEHDSTLLCTAETVAALLDRSTKECAADCIRSRLDLFQQSYYGEFSNDNNNNR